MGSRTENDGRRWRLLAVLGAALAAAFLWSGVGASEQPLPAGATIMRWAADHPGQPVPLIIQHDGSSDDLAAFVRSSGGTVENDFHIIPALDVAVPAGVLDDLAARSDVGWLTLDAPVASTAAKPTPTPVPTPGGKPPMDSLPLPPNPKPADPKPDPWQVTTAYPYSVDAPDTWATASGDGVTVAVIDTGLSSDVASDFIAKGGGSRVVWVAARTGLYARSDGFGHGTHVSGIIAGESTTTSPGGKYTGIAPDANILAVRIADNDGNATIGDLMAGLQYVDDNRTRFNVGVLNLSVSSSVAQTYKVDPIDAAVELLWLHGITVVVASGNDGTAADAVSYPPANDPFVITVGAFDDQGTAALGDDALTEWSSRGTTQDGIAKPDVLGPGANIVSPVSINSYLAREYPEAIVETVGHNAYFNMSGTSMSSAAVSGVVALLLQANPKLTPGQIKYVLIKTARSLPGGKGVLAHGATSYKGTIKSTDDGIAPSYFLLAAVGVSGANLNGVRWRDITFNGIRWRGLDLNGIRWRTIDWSGLRWRDLDWQGLRWRGLDWQGIRWRGLRWRAIID